MLSSLDATPRPAHLGRPHPTLVAPDGDLSQRTGEGRVMTETNLAKNETACRLLGVCITQRQGLPDDQGLAASLRREGDPHEPIVKAFRAARKAAEASLTA